MAYDSWLPIGYEICPNICAGKVMYSGINWQIVRANDKKALLACDVLVKHWTDAGLVTREQFVEITFGEDTFYALLSDKQYDMSPIEESQQCWDLSDALSFANALKTTRALAPDVSFKDAIYVESCNRLLPTYTFVEDLGDDIILGYWLTNGVKVPVSSFRRLCSLMTWLERQDIEEILRCAGFEGYNVNSEELSEDISLQPALCNGQDGIILSSSTESNTDSVATIGYFSLPGRPILEKFFNEQIIDIVNNLEEYQRMGIDFPAPTILYGPPGSGKTYAVEKLASFMDWPLFYIDSSTIASSYIHATSKKIAEVFAKAKKNAPSIIIIDEMEAYLSSRAIGSESGMHHIEEVAQFLREIPNAPKNHLLIFGMTNMLELLDPAAIRQGRFDHKIEVGLPTREEVAALIQTTAQKLPIAEDVDFTEVINVLTNRPFSDAAFMFREAGRLAVKDAKAYIDNECITEALKFLPDNQSKKRKMGFDC